jgi:hypothetical protein
MYTADQSSTTTISGKSLKTWRLGIGANFGVDSSGNLYAKGATLNGLIVNNTDFSVTSTGSITAKSGTFGPWTLNSSGLSTSTLELNSSGLKIWKSSSDKAHVSMSAA